MSITLLLNASYEPIRVISWQKAVTLCFLEKVEVVEEYEREIRSVSLAIKMPAVVRLLRYINLGRRKPPLTRLHLLARDNYQCQYCRIPLTLQNLTVDHVVPRSQGGGTSWENVVAACPPCNRHKGGRTPAEAHMQLQKAPIHPEWLPIVTLRFRKQVPPAWLAFLKQVP